MGTHSFRSKFDKDSYVYHVTDEGRKGKVLDISYSVRHNESRYRVVFGISQSEEIWCDEEELSESPVFN